MDLKFNSSYIKNKILNKSKNIKNTLLDQKIISGIGNIYANEILNYSKIKPLKKTNELNLYEIQSIVKYSKLVIRKAILKGGSTIRNFKNSKGLEGSYQNEFRAYNRNQKKCLNKDCNGVIKRIFISNRSTFFCNKCQN